MIERLENCRVDNEAPRWYVRPLPVALRVASEIFEALGAAHEVGVIHRGVKPHNVAMLPTGKIEVLNFGIAQGLEARGPTA